MSGAEAATTVISSDGTEIALHDFGGAGPPLVVCHATGFHAHCYGPMMATLAARFRVFGLDFRGHGASPIPEGATMSWLDCEHDLAAVVEHLGEPVAAFGHSMGATSVLRVAARRSDAFTRAWVFEPIIVPGESTERSSMMADNAERRRAEFPSRAEAMARYAARPPFGRARADALLAYVEHGFRDTDRGTVELACRPRHEAMIFRGAKTLLVDVAAVTIPVVIARGVVVPDQPGAADFSAPVAAALSGASLAAYDDLSHLGPFEAPDTLATDAAAFLATE